MSGVGAIRPKASVLMETWQKVIIDTSPAESFLDDMVSLEEKPVLLEDQARAQVVYELAQKYDPRYLDFWQRQEMLAEATVKGLIPGSRYTMPPALYATSPEAGLSLEETMRNRVDALKADPQLKQKHNFFSSLQWTLTHGQGQMEDERALADLCYQMIQVRQADPDLSLPAKALIETQGDPYWAMHGKYRSDKPRPDLKDFRQWADDPKPETTAETERVAEAVSTSPLAAANATATETAADEGLSLDEVALASLGIDEEDLEKLKEEQLLQLQKELEQRLDQKAQAAKDAAMLEAFAEQQPKYL